VNDQPVICLVVHVQNSFEKRVRAGYTFDEEIWIDKQRETI
jgi:hypothetical protein